MQAVKLISLLSRFAEILRRSIQAWNTICCADTKSSSIAASRFNEAG